METTCLNIHFYVFIDSQSKCLLQISKFIIQNIVKHRLHVWLIPFHVHSNLLPRFSSGSIIVALTVTTSRGGGGAGRVVVHLKIRGIYNLQHFYTRMGNNFILETEKIRLFPVSDCIVCDMSISFQFFCITRYFESVELQSNHGDGLSK